MGRRDPDVKATVKFFRSDQGGRDGPTPADSLRCILVVDDKNFDVALWLEEVGSVSPGQTVQVPMSFVSPALAMKHVTLGKKFFLRDYRRIAEGVFDEICVTGTQ